MYIKGNFRKYIFKSDNGYVVGLFKVRDASEEYLNFKNKTITFTGYFSDLNDADLYKLNGKFTTHERYGEQFQTDSFEVVMPEEKDNIIEFLSSDIFPGIGEKKACKIVEVLGNDALKKILEDKTVLLSVPTVTTKQMDKIYDCLYKYQYNYEVIVSLTNLGFSTKESLSIYKAYDKACLDIVKENPYQILDDIKELTFNKIDLIRNNFNISSDSNYRIEAGIKFCMNDLSFKTGNTYFTIGEIVSYVKRVLNVYDEILIRENINNLINENIITKIEEKLFLTETYEMDEYIANRLFSLANTTENVDISIQDIERLEEEFNIKFNDEQIKAIKGAFDTRCLVITGGPGVGKTTIIKAITRLYKIKYKLSDQSLINNLALLAPTGRASKRISEQTNLPAYTIHRFLKWNKEDNSFQINEENKSKVKFIIIDEASMLDTMLLYNLLLGINENTKIIFIGDYNQLPSVGAGQVFKDLIESECINTIYLKRLYRQKEGSSIVQFANDILEGNLDMSLFIKNEELTFIPCNDFNIKENLKEFILTYRDVDINNFQVLAPIYKGDNGIDGLNYYIQDILNEDKVLKNNIIVDGVKIYKNDKIIQLVNDPDNNVFNGDIGQIVSISQNPREVVVDYDGNVIELKQSNFSNIKLGYAISIHKSQGSEFNIIIMIVLNKYSPMLYKKLLYTGVTRAKKKLIILGEEDALLKCIKNERESNRNTYLKNLILKCIKTSQ